jgi:predicted amidohydrolase
MPKSKNPIVAVAQIKYFDTSARNNVAKIKKYISLAGKAKADIVCFPESCVHDKDYLQFDDVLIREICDACKQNKIWTIITDNFRENGMTYQMSLLIDRDGEIKGNYKKINLYDDDCESAGDKVFTYQTDFAKIGIAICWDLAFPELFAQMKKEGAQIVFNPSYWCYEDVVHKKDHKNREIALVKSLIKSRAFENLFFLAYANPIIKRDDLISYSAIVAPHHILKEIKDKEGMIVQEINLKELEKFRKLYPNKN